MGLDLESWPRPVRTLIKTSNKYLLNPVMLRLAGRRYWYASVIRHTGRSSGKQYSTPIVADRVGEHFIAPLPYGIQVDWVRNVIESGRATLVSKGRTYQVRSPEIIDATQALPLLPADRRRTFSRIGVEHFLRVRVG